MKDRQRQALLQRGTDVQGAQRRFYGDEAFYTLCLSEFMKDKTMEELNTTVKNERWDDAFTAAHALKGLAGNMGFVPLMHSVGQLVILIRGGRIKEIDDCMLQVNSSYRDILDAIHDFFTYADAEPKGE